MERFRRTAANGSYLSSFCRSVARPSGPQFRHIVKEASMKIEYRFGKRIRELRLGQGWTQGQLAEIAGLEARTVQRVEADQTRGGETLMAIAQAFGVEVKDLRVKYWVPESRPLQALMIEKADDFAEAIRRAHHEYGHIKLLPGFTDTELEHRVDELVEDIFADIWAMEPGDWELLPSWIESIRQPLGELYAMNTRFFSVQECRDCFMKGSKPGERVPLEDWTRGYFLLVPRHGCFHLGGKSSREPVHQFNADCDSALQALVKLFEPHREGVGIFANALCAVTAAGGENNMSWCDACFPRQKDGARVSWSYAEGVTGLTVARIREVAVQRNCGRGKPLG